MLLDQKTTDVESLDKSDDVDWDHSDETSDPNMVSSSAAKANNLDEQSSVATKEDLFVTWLRQIVFGVLLVTGVLVCIIVYDILTRSEDEELESYYDGAAAAVIQAFHDIASSKLGAISSLALAIASTELAGQSWPLVTVANFQQRAAVARKQSGALLIHMNPIVTDDERPSWEAIVANVSSDWIDAAEEYQDNIDMLAFAEKSIRPNLAGIMSRTIYENGTMPIWDYSHEKLAKEPVQGPGPYMPVWQSSPVLLGGADVNKNAVVNFEEPGANISYYSESLVIGRFHRAPPGDIYSDGIHTRFSALLISVAKNETRPYTGDPFSQIFFPVYASFNGDAHAKPVAIITAWLQWGDYFNDVLPSKMKGIILVFRNSCSGSVTFEINGSQVAFIGELDLHDLSFDHMRRSASLADTRTYIADGSKYGLPMNKDHCAINIDIYPSATFSYEYQSHLPLVISIAIGSIFLFTVGMFAAYDSLVERRQKSISDRAEKASAIVTSLFPENVRDRLMQEATVGGEKTCSTGRSSRLREYLEGRHEDDIEQAPITDFFPQCTVLFADIAGFTAWSSTRDPTQVFSLLQTVYQAFDNLAKHHKVFKVETIGDSYVAVTGLPEPQEMHAVIMARFAIETQRKLNQLLPRLECSLGPDTADLSMRYGLHSGPVTAGVLRGERARFQLFGDTVNTAARMESNGIKGKIQVSQSTRDLLVEAGKASWITPRPDTINAKGKGVMKTYFVAQPPVKEGSIHQTVSACTELSGSASVSSLAPASMPEPAIYADNRRPRLVNWVADLLQEHMRKLVAARAKTAPNVSFPYAPREAITSLDEVAEVIVLPRLDFSQARGDITGTRPAELDAPVVDQLLTYVGAIAELYRYIKDQNSLDRSQRSAHAPRSSCLSDNPFHNFEHACHVTMACNKFMQRIVGEEGGTIKEADENAAELQKHTHGVTSDPLARLAIVLSALIHDVDHPGVSNARLAVEDEALAMKYRNQSVAEQKSLDLAWNLLMEEDKFIDLRNALFTTDAELKRFRQILVNMVLATDIFDEELNDLRKERWEKAFSAQCFVSPEESRDLRDTIIMEHIIQASDVSHTMQHCCIYRKWNQRLFRELSLAYSQGRMAKDPSEFWYQGEIGFFDNYVIPLARKLKECQVFGVSSDECLDYAIQNRNEWIAKGEALVEQMKEELQRECSREGSAGSQEPTRSESTKPLFVSHESFDEWTTTELTERTAESSSVSLTILVDEFGRIYFHI